MVLKIFTRGDGPESRDAVELGRRVNDEGYDVEYFDLDDQATQSLTDLYDIHSAPAAMVTTEDGKLIEIWQGEMTTESEIKNLMRI